MLKEFELIDKALGEMEARTPIIKPLGNQNKYAFIASGAQLNDIIQGNKAFTKVDTHLFDHDELYYCNDDGIELMSERNARYEESLKDGE